MEEEVNEQLKLAEMKKEKLKQSLDALSSHSTSLLEVSVKWKVFDEHCDSMVKLIEKKRDEAVSEIRVRENELKNRVEKIRVFEERLEDLRRRDLDEVREKERKAEKRLDDLRRRDFNEMWEKEMKLKEWEKRVIEMDEELKKREERLGILRSGIFGEILKEKMALEEREMRVEVQREMEREVEERAMRIEEERMKLAKKFDDREKAMEWRGKRLDHRKQLLDAKVKELEAREMKVEEEENAVRRRGTKLEMKKKKMEKEHHRTKKALKYVVNELEGERDQNIALREEVSLLTQKLESSAKSCGESVTTKEEGNLANQHNVAQTEADIALDGRTIQMYINDMAGIDESWQCEVHTILQRVSDPAKVVLDAMEGFYPPHLIMDGKQFDTGIVRNTCVCLLRTLNSISPSVDPVLKDEALKLAFEWKKRMTVKAENPLEILGFLELVMAYGLTKEFNGFELLNHSKIAYSQVPPSKLLQDLGCADNISPGESTPYKANSNVKNTMTTNIAYVTSLISNNQRVQALKYICESDLDDVFSISTIVDVHVNYLKQYVIKLLDERGKTADAEVIISAVWLLEEAAEFELAGLKDLVNCLEANGLQDRYSPECLKDRIAQLETQFYSMNRAAPSLKPIYHVGPNTGDRPFKKARLLATGSYQTHFAPSVENQTAELHQT